MPSVSGPFLLFATDLELMAGCLGLVLVPVAGFLLIFGGIKVLVAYVQNAPQRRAERDREREKARRERETKAYQEEARQWSKAHPPLTKEQTSAEARKSYQRFVASVNALDLPPETKEALIQQAEAAFVEKMIVLL